MFEELNAKLAIAKEKGRNQEKWQSRLKHLQQELHDLEHKAHTWSEQYKDEEKDVSRLTGISVSNLFYTLLGTKEEKLRREQQKVLEAKVKYDEAVRSAADVRRQIAELERKLQEVRNWEMEYESAMQEKEKLLLPKHVELSALADRQAELVVEVKELQEAIREGQSVEANLQRAEETFGSAKSWGTYDILGGGLLATSMKHSRIDEAMEHIHQAQICLRRFETELKDVRMTDVSVDLDISGFLRFADYFFDGFIADLTVQGKINDTLEQVREKRSAIDGIVDELSAAHRRAEAELHSIKRKYSALIENAD